MLDENPNLFFRGELNQEEHFMDEKRARQERIRHVARKEFVKSEGNAAIQRALLGRPRSHSGDYQPGLRLRLPDRPELGYLFQARAMHKDLHTLIDNLEADHDVFMDATGEDSLEPEAASSSRIRANGGSPQPSSREVDEAEGSFIPRWWS